MGKKIFILFHLLLFIGQNALGQSLPSSPAVYTEASSLTLVGKLFTDTPHPYHRVDTSRFKGFSKAENLQVRESSGLAVAFRTDSPFVTVRTAFGQTEPRSNATYMACMGYDLYIRSGKQWLYAGSAPRNSRFDLVAPVKNMDGTLHECLLYLPLYSEVHSVQIGIAEGAVIEALPLPFRHRIAVFGSSFTHGASTSRSGMTYPAQLSRNTGFQLLSLGCDGNCKLQPYFADILAAADADAFLFDAFSNPSPAQIRERLFPFIETIQAAHPGKPLIFQRTIYRENRNFDTAEDLKERERAAVADSLMSIALKRYKDIYFITPDATDDAHDTSVDGIHPDDHGYALWARSIEKPLKRILRKYGLR